MTDSISEMTSSRLLEDPSSVTATAHDNSITMSPTCKTELFSRLPPEIREQIWLHALSPRTIHLHFHSRIRRPRQRVHGRGARTHTTAISFSASLGPINAKSFKYRPAGSWPVVNEDSHPLKEVPPVPAALFVCCESREIALQHCNYELAFAGQVLETRDSALLEDAEKWLGQTKEKRIWVDFGRDEIVMSTLWPFSHALEEARKIQRLGIYVAGTSKSFNIVNYCGGLANLLPLVGNGLRQLSLYLRFVGGDEHNLQSAEESMAKNLALAREIMKSWLAESLEVKVVLYKP